MYSFVLLPNVFGLFPSIICFRSETIQLQHLIEMSGFEAQARILHQSNQIRDEIKSLYNWEQDMKNMEAKRTAVPDAEVGSFLCVISVLFGLSKLLHFRRSITVFHCGIRCKHQNHHRHRHRRPHHRSIVNRQLVVQPANWSPM